MSWITSSLVCFLFFCCFSLCWIRHWSKRKKYIEIKYHIPRKDKFHLTYGDYDYSTTMFYLSTYEPVESAHDYNYDWTMAKEGIWNLLSLKWTLLYLSRAEGYQSFLTFQHFLQFLVIGWFLSAHHSHFHLSSSSISESLSSSLSSSSSPPSSPSSISVSNDEVLSSVSSSAENK